MTYNLPLNTTQIPRYLRKIADIPQFQTWMKNRIEHLPDDTISAAEYENQCEAALLLSAGIPKNRVVLEELFARTGGQPLNTWDLLYVMKLYEAAAAGVHFYQYLEAYLIRLCSHCISLSRDRSQTIRLQVI